MMHNQGLCWRMWLGAVSVWASMASITVVNAFVQTRLFSSQQQKYSYASKFHFIPLAKFGWVLVRSKNAAGMHHLHLQDNRAGGNYDNVIHNLSELRQSSYHKLLNSIPSSVQIVLIGEGTHGTEEFFHIRSEVTQILIKHHGFNAILCEGDVHPFFELNNYVTNNNQGTNNFDASNDDDDIRSKLANLFCNRFPDFMWSNVPMVSFVHWLKKYNNKYCNSNTQQQQQQQQQNKLPVQLLGMDIQFPFDSMEYIIQQLKAFGENDLASLVEEYYEPLWRYQINIRIYGSDVYSRKVASLENAVQKAHSSILDKYDKMIKSANINFDFEEIQIWFQVIQSSYAVVASEAYHRQRIYPGHTTTWNIRTNAMFSCILQTIEYINHMNGRLCADRNETDIPLPPRLVVWAHNSHVGDMRSTGYSSLGQNSLGQLCRETFGHESTFLIGMTTYQGAVRAAFADRRGACWKGSGEIMTLRKAIDGSHENALHLHSIATSDTKCREQEFGLDLQSIRLHDGPRVNENGGIATVPFDYYRPGRFVGSCYLPQTEMMSHYTECNLATQFDYAFHVDESSALTV